MDAELSKRIHVFESELLPLLIKHNLKMDVVMEFPDYRNLPVEVQLALLVVAKHNPQYNIVYKDKKGK